jgi:hypothetical protein
MTYPQSKKQQTRLAKEKKKEQKLKKDKEAQTIFIVYYVSRIVLF